jgi:hypothetical protein
MELKSLLFILFALVAVVAVTGEKSRYDNYRVYNIEIANGEQLDAMKYLADTSDSVKKF